MTCGTEDHQITRRGSIEGPGPCFDNDIGTDPTPVLDIDHDIGTDHNLRDHDLNTDVDLALDHDIDFNPVHDFAIDLSGGRLAERKTIKAPAGDRWRGLRGATRIYTGAPIWSLDRRLCETPDLPSLLILMLRTPRYRGAV